MTLPLAGPRRCSSRGAPDTGHCALPAAEKRAMLTSSYACPLLGSTGRRMTCSEMGHSLRGQLAFVHQPSMMSQ